MRFPFVLFAIIVVAVISIVLRRNKEVERRRIGGGGPRPVDLTSWRAFASGMGLKLNAGILPRMVGLLDGDQIRIQRLWTRGSRTRARIRASVRKVRRGKLHVRPRGDHNLSSFEHRTGDRDFDREFRVHCFKKGLPELILTDEVRAWIRALGNVEVEVSGAVATALVPGFEDDPDRLRGLLELCRAVAGRMRAAAAR